MEYLLFVLLVLNCLAVYSCIIKMCFMEDNGKLEEFILGYVFAVLTFDALIIPVVALYSAYAALFN